MRTALIFSLFLTTAALDARAENIPSYGDISQIPAPLLGATNLGINTQFREGYVAQVLGTLRQVAPDKLSLNRQQLAELQEKNLLEGRRQSLQQHINNFIGFDSNLDDKVDAEELKNNLTGENQGYRAAQAEQFMETYDTNKDGIATLEEAKALALSTPSPRMNRRNDTSTIEELFKLDPNNDGTLTIAELETFALKAFRTIDKDNNGILTDEERTPIMPLVQQRMQEQEQRLKMEQLGCHNIPKPAADETVVYIGTYSGVAISTVTLTGQSEETNVIPFNINSTNGKFYVIAATYSPTIWQFSGNTAQISRLVLAGYSRTPNNRSTPAAGATGVSAERISYMSSECVGQRFYGSEGRSNQRAEESLRTTLKALVNREPDTLFMQHRIGALTLLGNKPYNIMESQKRNQPVPPTGFDSTLWAEAIKGLYPMGFIAVDPGKVVTSAKAEAYEVLPGWIGIAKLLDEGRIVREIPPPPPAPGPDASDAERTRHRGMMLNYNASGEGSRNYRIVKEIPYYPSGLHGAHLVRFTIAKGVPAPKGSPGHSCVIDENTGSSRGPTCSQDE